RAMDRAAANGTTLRSGSGSGSGAASSSTSTSGHHRGRSGNSNNRGNKRPRSPTPLTRPESPSGHQRRRGASPDGRRSPPPFKTRARSNRKGPHQQQRTAARNTAANFERALSPVAVTKGKVVKRRKTPAGSSSRCTLHDTPVAKHVPTRACVPAPMHSMPMSTQVPADHLYPLTSAPPGFDAGTDANYGLSGPAGNGGYAATAGGGGGRGEVDYN
ncbi:hypothetical protein BGX29_005295, partial [Mortierella sp. GBA35]